MELNKRNPVLQIMTNCEYSDMLNSYQHGQFYCPELYAFKRLRFFCDYKSLTVINHDCEHYERQAQVDKPRKFQTLQQS